MSVNALIFTEITNSAITSGRALGAYKIATELRKNGYTCQVIDCFTSFSDAEIDMVVSSFIGNDTLMVGFSSTFFSYIDPILYNWQQKNIRLKKMTANFPYHSSKMMVLFDKIKNINPKIKIILGGAKSLYLIGPVDAFAVGYCDQAIVEYMKYLEGKNPFFQFEKINETQIAFYGSNYTTSYDFNASTVDWHETDCLQHGESVPIEVARGCIFRCKFCAYPLNGKKKLDYIKYNDILRDEFLKNYYEHGITRYTYVDDTHNDSVEKLERLHKIVNSLPFELEYAAYLRLDLIYAHKHTASLLRESGLRAATFGIESLNHKAASAIGKGLHPTKIKETLHWLKDDVWKNEVAMTSGFIVGLPNDTPETVREWSKWILDPVCPLDSFIVYPLGIGGYNSKGRVWRNEFELGAEKYGYVLGINGDWSNKYFTMDSADAIATEINEKARTSGRLRMAGFQLVALANLGYAPAELIGKQRSAELLQQIRERTTIYVNNYKNKLFKRM